MANIILTSTSGSGFLETDFDQIKGALEDATYDINTGAIDTTELSINSTAVTATATELNYVDGVTSPIQAQIDGKSATSHTHTLSDVTDSGALAALATVDTAQIDDEAITEAKLDVLDTPNDGEVLSYNTSSSRFEWVTNGGGISQLSDLSDVGVTTPTNKNVLVADGDSWESRALVEADISDFGTYLTSESNDLSASVTWADVPDINITESSVTQHEAAIDHDALTNFVANEHIDWTSGVDNQIVISYSSAGHSISLTPTGDAGNSQSTGGAFFINNTSNPGSAIVVYTNEDSASSGHLVQLGADNVLFDQTVLRVWTDGVGKSATFDSNSTTTTNETVSIGASSDDATTIGVTGHPTDKGVVKITHSGATSDGGSAGMSVDLSGTGTAAKGYYLDATGGGTTGHLVQLRNNGSDKFIVDASGTVDIASGQTYDINGSPHTHTTSEITDLSSWVGSSNITSVGESAVTAHEAALSITESQISDLDHDAVKIQGVGIDATVGSPSDGDILVYRTAGSDWVLETKPAGGSSSTLSDITDVTLTTVGDNEVLAYDNGSGEWINQTASEAGLAAASHTHVIADITDFTDNSSNWNTAYGWGDHSTEGYLTSVSEAAVTAHEAALSITESQISDLGTYLENVSEDTTPQLGGDLDLNSNGLIIAGQTVGGSNGDLVYLSGSETWSQADADAESTCSGMLGIRVSASSVLVQGVYTTTGLTAANTYYASATAGGITTTAPSTTGQIVRIVGYALSTTEFYFDPDKSYIEVA